MARKSRKNMMPQVAVQEAVQQNEKELLRTAAYARLSVENGGHETEDSLHTQILQIHNYIRENPELTLTDTYADNGFTGTRFDRPEFERMMQDVRTGKIQCIVVKDLSRFGRDYIETGSYLETIFPMLHVRFIAINDDFDNIRQSDVDSLAVPIDISTGDVITPRAIEFNYDLLLEDRSISLWSYNLETILAEKLQTVLARGILNTRMRDFYDIRMLLDTYEDKVNKAVLKDAFAATCKKRGTDHLQEQAEEIIKIIEANEQLQVLWRAYEKKYSYAADIDYASVISGVRKLMDWIR